MHVKYLQPLADMESHYEEILERFDKVAKGQREVMLQAWGIDVGELELIKEEREALRYLVACRLEFAHNEDVSKPTVEVAERCFKRHLGYLEKVHKCTKDTVNGHRSKLVQKQYKACRHYLFKFSLGAWYEKLPNQILSFENKYKNRDF